MRNPFFVYRDPRLPYNARQRIWLYLRAWALLLSGALGVLSFGFIGCDLEHRCIGYILRLARRNK